MSNESKTTQINTEAVTNSIKNKVNDLIGKYQELPEKLDAVNKSISNHRELIKSIDSEIKKLNEKLSTKNILEDPLREKISVYDKTIIRFEKTVLVAERRKLRTSLKILEKRGKDLLKIQTSRTLISDLREKVKDPTYYKKYNSGIYKALNKLFEQDIKELKERLPDYKNLLETDEKLLLQEFKKFLMSIDTPLYIRFSGNEEWQQKFFEKVKQLIGSQ